MLHRINMAKFVKLTNNAFTLIEVIITASLMLVLIIGGINFFMKVKGVSSSAGAKGQLNSEIRKARTELLRSLKESTVGSISISTVFDPLDSQSNDILVFASRRDSYGNYSFGGSNEVVWRSAVVIYPYVTSSGIKQLRKYVDDSYDYNQADSFPINIGGVTSSTINLTLESGSPITIIRSGGEVLCNYLIGNGAEFSLSNNLLTFRLSLGKNVFSQGLVTQTVEDTVKLRN